MAKLPSTQEKKVMRVEDRGDVGAVNSPKITAPVSDSNKKYFKTATVNGYSITAFIVWE